MPIWKAHLEADERMHNASRQLVAESKAVARNNQHLCRSQDALVASRTLLEGTGPAVGTGGAQGSGEPGSDASRSLEDPGDHRCDPVPGGS